MTANTLRKALERLSAAALARDATMGDPCTMMAAKAELAAANKAACTALAAPEPEPVARFINTATQGQKPHWEQVADEHANDPDVMPLYAAPPAAPAPAAPVPDGWVMVPRGLLRRLIAEALTFDPYLQDKEAIEQAKQLAAAPAVPAAPVPDGWVLVPREPTPEMIAAYLAANTQYWAEVDALPSTPVTKWRQGTPSDATRESYRAMIAASPAAPVVPLTDEQVRDIARALPFGDGSRLSYIWNAAKAFARAIDAALAARKGEA